MEQTVLCHHRSEEAAEAHAHMLTREGFTATVEPDDDRWLVSAHRHTDDGDDAYTVERVEAF
jgi:hypothetical protein